MSAINELKKLVAGHTKLIDIQNAALALLKNPNWKPEIKFPSNMYLPENASSIEIKNAFDVTAGTSEEIIRFVAPQGGMTRLTHYAIVNDGLLAADFDFFPRVNGRRIYRFHGDPLDNFRIYLANGATLENTNLNHSPITLQPGQTLTWVAENRAAVDTTMGVRVVGYFTRSETRRQVKWGG